MKRVVVVGGGAAGFFGAIASAPAQVTLLEAGPKVLTKVLISGGGRCNVTHACFEPAILAQHYPRGAKALRGAFSRFQASDTVAWFQERGVALKTEADGRIFPTTDQSVTIANCLRASAEQAGVKVLTNSPVIAVQRQADRFKIITRSGLVFWADCLLLATGSSAKGYQIAASLGHAIVPPVPSLFTFNIVDPRLADLAGISIDPVNLRLRVAGQSLEQTGPLLITHWGLSGPAVLKLSAWGARLLHGDRYQAQLTINWLPEYPNPEMCRQFLWSIKSSHAPKLVTSTSLLPKRLWQKLVTESGITPQQRWGDLSKQTLGRLVQQISQGQYQITGKGVFKEEFVTCGGVDLAGVDFQTMESRLVPGLYFAGEILDIDGITGGFNFQSAWTTGWLAGQSIANFS